MDSDGIQEVAWISQMVWGDPLTTEVELSYFVEGSGFRTHSVAVRVYNGCERFLPAKQCRGSVKWRDDRGE